MPRKLPILFAFLWATASFAQQTPHDQASYEVWKHVQMSTITPTPPAVQHGSGSNGTLRGGSSCDCWVQPDASYTTIDNNSQWDANGFQNADDGSYGPIALPFQFYLYGQFWSTAYININGNVSFGQPYGTFSASGFPVSGYTMVAPFWADVDLRGPGVGNNIVQFKVTPTALYVNWTNVGYYSQMTDKVNTFQLIISDGIDPIIPNGANVSFCYLDMQWTTGSASGGVNGFGGTPANVGANQGNGVDYLQFGRFDHAGIDYDGPYGNNDGVDWLDTQHFTFSTDITTANVPPSIVSQSVCDSLVVCVGEMATLDVTFLSPEPLQTTVANATCPTLSNWNIVTNTSGLNAQIVVQFTPTAADVGYHNAIFTGTDDGIPVQTSTLNVVIEVQQGAVITPGTMDVCDNGTPVNMITVLGGNPPAGGDWTDPNGLAHNGTFVPGTDMDGAYTYAVGVGSNCASSGTATFTTVPHVDAGQDVSLAYCSSNGPDDLFLNIPGTPMTGGAWLDPNNGAFSGTLHPGTDPEGDYHYVVNGSGPCPNDTSTISVAIPQYMDPGLDDALTLCTDADTLDMITALGGTPDAGGTWLDPNGQASNGFFVAATGMVGGYVYTVSPDQPCPTLSSTLTLSVDPLPKAGNDAPLTVCEDAPNFDLYTLLGGSPDAGGVWTGPASDQHLAILDPATDTSGTYTYVVQGIGTCDHLTDTSHVQVTINKLPIVTFFAEPDSGCNPLEVKLTNTTDSISVGNNCVWDLGDGSVVDACDTLVHTYQDPGWYTVTLTVTSPEGCTDHTTVPGLVVVDPAPQATFTFSPNPGTENNANIFFAADDPEAIAFHWDFAGLDSASGRFAYHQFEDVLGGTYDVCLDVVDQYGCVDTLCKVVEVLVPTFYMPNAFTPNGDGTNDVLRPVTIGMVPEDHRFSVYDRWGQIIFDSTDPEEGWDGSFRNGGTTLPQGVYVWRLVERPTYSSDKKEWVGRVTLLH
ncbi:MAG: gliding motility-associated C-terminal domain-containing protein [Flavobacteriales bacterium]|nr:gliding motility-associated C-terminal domain-containing protein [Flavobacteriales bacterium]MCB9194026.1 gliding motility-associated C-terminal domain-containing protein [Flavobacteriales bacterium]